MKTMLLLGAVAGFVGVALGAFGAHGLRASVTPERLATWETAVLYNLVHAVIVCALAMAPPRYGGPALVTAGAAMLIGTLVFSGSLYLLVLTGQRWLGAITPFGGVAFLVGWVALAVAAWRGI